MTDPLAYLDYDDLDETLQLVAHYVGMDAVRKLIEHLPGESIAVPKTKRIPGLVRRYLETEYNGENVPRLARSLGASKEHIRRHLREIRDERQGPL